MWSIVFFFVLFLSLASAFKNVFVVVVRDTSYLSAISGKGQLTDYSYSNLDSSIVSILRNKKQSWGVFTDNNVNCTLSSSILGNYSYLISQSDVKSISKPCAYVRDSTDLQKIALYTGHLPQFSIYFPSPENASSATWLRKALYPAFSSSTFLERFITVILTEGENQTAKMLLLGNDALHPPQLSQNNTWWNSLQEYFVGLTWVPPPPPPPVWFDRIFIVILENQPIDTVLTNYNMRHFAAQGTMLMDFNAIVNPSQPNYVALTGGDTMGVVDDEVYDLNSTNIVDLFEEKGVSWKSYQENYPGPCYAGKREGLYVRKHNPFMSFDSVRQNATRCAKIVHSDELKEDIEQNNLPKYMFYTPNMNNNGHDTGLSFSSKWLAQFLPPLLTNDNFMRNTLVVVTYDEGIKPHNRIYTLFLGDMIPFGNIDNTSYTHYSLLRLVEDQFGLGSLGRNDVDAPIIRPTHFRPGSIPKMKSSLMLYVGIAVGAVLVVCALFATFYYIFVIRRTRRSSRTKPLVLKHSQEREEEDDDDDYDEDYEDDYEERTKRVKGNLSITLSV